MRRGKYMLHTTTPAGLALLNGAFHTPPDKHWTDSV
jgi:hypothetical protein